MWALVEDNSIVKIINNPKGMVIGDTRYSKNIFSFRWTNEEREAIGLYEIVFDSSNKKDDKWYINTNQTFDFADDTVTASYGSATPREHADTLWTAQDEIDGKGTEGEVATRGLKYNLIQTVKQQASAILQDTDWYVVRKADAGTEVPSEITTHRASVRTKADEMETAINNASNTPALEILYTYTKQEDGSVTRPLGELPTLES
jgi:hypothetical protein